MKKNKIFPGLLVCVLLSVSSHAATFNYQGQVDGGSGALSTLIMTGATLSGYIEMDVPGPGQTTMDTGIITAVSLIFVSTIGIPQFCLSLNTSCQGAGVEAPIQEISGLFLAFDSLGQPASGVIDLAAFAPLLDLELPLRLDLSSGVFTMAPPSGTFGFVSGVGNFQLQPVPLPGAFWLFVSGLFFLVHQRRN